MEKVDLVVLGYEWECLDCEYLIKENFLKDTIDADIDLLGLISDHNTSPLSYEKNVKHLAFRYNLRRYLKAYVFQLKPALSHLPIQYSAQPP